MRRLAVHLSPAGTVQEAGILRVGLYEPGATKPSWLYGRAFHPTSEDRRELMKSLKGWDKINFGDMSLEIFANDLPDTDGPAKELMPLMPKAAPCI